MMATHDLEALSRLQNYASESHLVNGIDEGLPTTLAAAHEARLDRALRQLQAQVEESRIALEKVC
jgi:hypothetical protein